MSIDETMLRTLRERGVVVAGIFEPEHIRQINEWLLARPVYADAHVPQTARNLGQGTMPREQAAASECVCVHTDDAILAPHVFEYAMEYLDLASAYLGRDPAVSYSANAFWTRPGSAAPRKDIQAPHCDQDDERFLVMFVYLTDVACDADGPHELIEPDGIPRVIYGPAGTVLLSDTSHPHRGLKPTSRERGIMWWRWGVSDRPAANAWDKIEPIAASRMGVRYPASHRLRESIRLLVRDDR